jgi:exosortase
MKSKFSSVLNIIIKSPVQLFPVLIVVCTAIYSLYLSVYLNSQKSSAIVLWTLASGICYLILQKNLSNPPPIKDLRGGKAVAWIMVGSAIALGLFNIYSPAQIDIFKTCVFLGVCAIAAFCGGFTIMLKLICPFFIFIFLVPSQAYFHYLLSYPMRLVCSFLTVSTLNLFGIEAAHQAAVIYLGPTKISVTTACSGIDQLESMLLIGWLIVVIQHKKFIPRVLHYMMLVPVIILANTLRLTVTLVLFLKIGAPAFSNAVHWILGALMVMLCAFLMWGCSFMFSAEKSSNPESNGGTTNETP